MFKTFAKSIAGASILAISLAGAAHAEQEITVDIEFDRALLVSDAGADAVLKSISNQAIKECRTVSLVSSGFHRDQICELDVIHKAVTKIGATQLADAYEGSEYYIEAPVSGVVLASN